LDRVFNEKFPDNEDDVFTDMEVTYTASLLKRKVDVLPEAEVKRIFNKAMRTLKYKMKELLLEKSFKGIQEKYVVPEGKEEEGFAVLHSNTIKLLLRCKKLTEAKVQVNKILRKLIKREEFKDQMLEKLDTREANLSEVEVI
jgi:hypothetical protein